MNVESQDFEYKQSSRTAAREIDGQAVVIVIDTQTLYTLNEVGAVVWNTLATQSSLESLRDAVCAEFDVSEDDAMTDVKTFLAELQKIGAIESHASMTSNTGESEVHP